VRGDGSPLRVLLVSYAWPPTGGVGTGRVLKLAKYAADHRIRPSVLTVSNPSVPLIDPSLLRDVPAGIEVIRARSLEPGYASKAAVWRDSSTPAARGRGGLRLKSRILSLARQFLVPDPQVLWLPAAAAALARRLRSPDAEDVVFITAPPFSSFLAGPLTRLRRGTALVLDYRDEWSTVRSSYEMSGRLAAFAGAALERRVVRYAHAITVATVAFRAHLLADIPHLDPSRVHVIPNGYDPDDFPPVLPDPPSDRFVLTYAGTVYRLTSARGLLAAVRLLHERNPDFARRLHVRFIGRIVETEADAFDGMERYGVERVGFLPKDQVIPELAASHMALVLHAHAAGTERIYPAKAFELMHLGRPVLAITPRGVLWDLVERHHLGHVFDPDDAPAIAAFLDRSLRDFCGGQYVPEAAAIDTERFHRRALAGEFAAVFRTAADLARANAV